MNKDQVSGKVEQALGKVKLGLSDAVQHPFQSVLGQHETKIFLSLAGEVQ